jgi:DNA-binding NtrC family response regulator
MSRERTGAYMKLAGGVLGRRGGGHGYTLKEAVRRFEQQFVLAALGRARSDKRRAALMLGISLASLYRKLDAAPSVPHRARSHR